MDCPKFGNDKRKTKESHVIDIREAPDAKKSKKEEERDIYYD